MHRGLGIRSTVSSKGAYRIVGRWMETATSGGARIDRNRHRPLAPYLRQFNSLQEMNPDVNSSLNPPLRSGHHCTLRSVMAAGALKGTVTELLTADTSGGLAVSCVTATNECPAVTFAEHVPVAVVGGIMVGHGTTVPGCDGTGALVS